MTVINLNKHRKALEKAEAKAKADANAVKFGRTKAERLRDAALAAKARVKLDQQKFEE
jgi:hypothetical protein